MHKMPDRLLHVELYQLVLCLELSIHFRSTLLLHFTVLLYLRIHHFCYCHSCQFLYTCNLPFTKKTRIAQESTLHITLAVCMIWCSYASNLLSGPLSGSDCCHSSLEHIWALRETSRGCWTIPNIPSSLRCQLDQWCKEYHLLQSQSFGYVQLPTIIQGMKCH